MRENISLKIQMNKVEEHVFIVVLEKESQIYEQQQQQKNEYSVLSFGISQPYTNTGEIV